MSEQIAIEKINRGAGTQSRAGLDGPTVYKYADAMRDGAQFPAVDLIYDGERYFIKDGFHRVAAALEAGFESIAATIEQGTLLDAQWASTSVNGTHGLPRSREDTRRAIIAALRHPYSAGKSDREIGRHVGVHHSTVGAVRSDLEMTGEISQSDERTGADGRTIDTSRIGSARANLPGAPKPALEQQRTEDKWVPAFPKGSLIFHVLLKRVGRVTSYGDLEKREYWVANPALPDNQILMDWPARHVRPATADDIQQAAEDATGFKVGETVRTRTGRIGQIVEISGRVLIVETEGGRQAHNAANLQKAEPLPVADEIDVEDQRTEDEQMVRLADGEQAVVHDDDDLSWYEIDKRAEVLSEIWGSLKRIGELIDEIDPKDEDPLADAGLPLRRLKQVIGAQLGVGAEAFEAGAQP